MKLVLATNNLGKAREVARILTPYGFDVTTPAALGCHDDIAETGATFAENALIKARYFHSRIRMATIADDSGLEVEALGGAPGIYSARYAGPNATDSERVAKLLDDMKLFSGKQRKAKFVCAAAIVWDRGEQVFVATVPGLITTDPRGNGGFGYDPVFLYEPLARTFAELTAAEKESVSHRGSAFSELAAWLRSATSAGLDSRGPDDRIEATAQNGPSLDLRGNVI